MVFGPHPKTPHRPPPGLDYAEFLTPIAGLEYREDVIFFLKFQPTLLFRLGSSVRPRLIKCAQCAQT